jgi:hypothetical protein
MPINKDYLFSKIGTTINGIRLNFSVDVKPPHCIVLQHVRTRCWLAGSDWEGEDNEEEWKFGEFWEAWVVGKETKEMKEKKEKGGWIFFFFFLAGVIWFGLRLNWLRFLNSPLPSPHVPLPRPSPQWLLFYALKWAVNSPAA